MASLFDKIASSAKSSSLTKSGEAREHPKKWIKAPIHYRVLSKISMKQIADSVQSFCNQEKIRTTVDFDDIRFDRIVGKSFVRWTCVLAIFPAAEPELIFQALSWYDNAGNEIAVLKLVSAIEKAILKIYPDTVVVENNEQKKLVNLYRTV